MRRFSGPVSERAAYVRYGYRVVDPVALAGPLGCRPSQKPPRRCMPFRLEEDACLYVRPDHDLVRHLILQDSESRVLLERQVLGSSFAIESVFDTDDSRDAL